MEALENDKLLTRAEVAEYLGVSEATLAAWASDGRNALPYLKLGRCVRYRKSQVDAWADQRQRTVTE